MIASVIYGAIISLTSTFILPKDCLKKIESLCSRFFWSDSIDGSKGAKVAWKHVCLPKNEGGLGLRRLTPWKQTLCLRLVWLLLSNNNSMWSKWHKFHNLGEDSFWEKEASPSNSWTWKTLMQPKPLAQRFIRSIVGNGQNTKFWFDQWTPLGPLINLLTTNGPSTTGIPLQTTVADACGDHGWKLRPAISEAAVTLHTHLTTISIPSEVTAEDSTGWFVNGSDCNGFSTSKTWDVVRQEKRRKTGLIWSGIRARCQNMRSIYGLKSQQATH